VPCFVSDPNCNKAHNEDLKRNISRHISATQTPRENDRATSETVPLAAAIPNDLQDLLNAWSFLPEHIRAAIMALVATVKP